jgi:hypothetical protein
MAKKNQIVPAAAPAETGMVKGNWLEEMKGEAKDLAAKFTVSSSRISFKSDGNIYVGDNQVDNPLPILIVAAAHENALYEGKFVPGKYTAPVCYAIGKDEDALVPHPDAPKPQHANCKTCPLNQFGSSGKGKACKNSVRLVALPGTVTEADVATAEAAQISIPPTSLNAWGSYVKGLRDAGLVPWATITHLMNAQFQTFFKVSFRPVNPITEPIYRGLKARMASFDETLLKPFSAAEAEEKKPAAKGRGKF